MYTYNGMPNSTPFLAAFGSLPFGHAPRCRLQELLGQWLLMPSLDQYMETFGEFISRALLARSKEKVNNLRDQREDVVGRWYVSTARKKASKWKMRSTHAAEPDVEHQSG